jgi:prepilin-type processing-associated H-X9-DG protein
VKEGTALNVGGMDGATGASGCAALAGQNGFYTGGNPQAWFGRRWNDGTTPFIGLTTILPPNGPSCVAGGWDGDWGINTPSSNHPGGVNLLLADGAVRFISETIDTQNIAAQQVQMGPSPYGVWGALGSRKGGEAKSNF